MTADERAELLRAHLERPARRGHTPSHAHTGAAGGAACGDLVRISLALDPATQQGRIADAGFEASGCGAAIAAGSAAVSLVQGRTLLEAARTGAREISAELGGLSAAKQHAAELAADALHRALGHAARACAPLAADPTRALVAMSGGVDSAVAALLTAHERAGSVAVTLELWSDAHNDGELSCCSAQAVRRARELAHGLGLPHLSIDLREEFRAGVVEHWLADHAAGLTPNPCIRCNGSVRLEAMLELAARLGAGELATGHYARIGEDGLLRIAVDERKDQSYVLCALSEGSLARMRFPLGSLQKSEVRALAERAGLAVARRRDSQDLCFLAGTTREAFLERHGGLGRRRGEVLALDGRSVGSHEGVHRYTVGQRRGLGLPSSEPLFVLASDARANTLTVGPRHALRTSELALRDVRLRRDGERVDSVRVRAHGRQLRCRLRAGAGRGARPPLEGAHGSALVQLHAPAERTAPGQLACLYAGDSVVGYGTIAA